ncbi:glutathione S-transferase N-terminal domain-containing protein [Ostreibacterium oceani]|uniref:Starvation protein A n=1 Tax=Ostreibacterium oceani TaxID=2654998 RepID=A0A6N7F1M5_9GAMM|nr:glutathione S-transferase N-terminal domain-containing protein [Ostreibacterium oceani]MPV86698.1 starvation protein A [Ostreibacterium oceani]
MNLLSHIRAGLTIVTDPVTVASHRVRLIVAEKSVEAEMVSISLDDPLPEDLMTLNPSGRVPTLLDRDLVLFDERVISEYLDERYPHPALMPIEPIVRAKLRLLVYRIESEWYSRMIELESNSLSANKRKQVIKELRDSVSQLSPLFKQGDFLLSDSMSLLDCAVLPVLWRLPHFGITLPEAAVNNLKGYAADMFGREGFKNALSDYEKELRKKG